VITGSKSGIGFETALALARKGAALILPARTRAKADDAAARILEQVPNAQLHPEILDLAARHDAGGSANAICGGCCEGSSWRLLWPGWHCGAQGLKGYPTAVPVPKRALDGSVAKRLWVESELLTRLKVGALSDVA